MRGTQPQCAGSFRWRTKTTVEYTTARTVTQEVVKIEFVTIETVMSGRIEGFVVLSLYSFNLHKAIILADALDVAPAVQIE